MIELVNGVDNILINGDCLEVMKEIRAEVDSEDKKENSKQ